MCSEYPTTSLTTAQQYFLPQGTSGKKNWNNYWLQENAKKRKTMMDKWVAEPSSVGDHSTSGGEVVAHIIENSGEFLAIKV